MNGKSLDCIEIKYSKNNEIFDSLFDNNLIVQSGFIEIE